MPTLADAVEQGQITVSVDGFGFRGEGRIRLQDGWLSVPGALPGERIVVDVETPRTPHQRRIWGTVVEILSASPRRSDPRCSRYPACRGCQLRHIPVVDELAYKAETVSECLEKFAGLPVADQPPVETISSPGASRADSYRVRTRLTVRHEGGAWAVGLIAGDHVVDMVECPALSDPTRRAVARFEAALESFEPPDGATLHHARIAAPVHGHGYVELEVDQDEGFDKLLAALDERLPPGFGLAIVADRGPRRHVRGPERIRLPMADLRLRVGFDDWFHATLVPAEALYDTITKWLSPKPGESVLDAGCGVGTIGLICAAAGADVVGVDINRASVESAELNALENGLDVRFVCGGWERAFRNFTLAQETFETVVINPMREPLGHRALAFLPRLQARRILYLGPSAASASKDLGVLRDLGYRIDRLGAVNLHPATYHVMLAALLTREI